MIRPAGQVKDGTCAVWGGNALLEPPPAMMDGGVCENLSRALL
jgi:hypothetical protein